MRRFVSVTLAILSLIYSFILQAEEIRVATAANFYPVLNELKQTYEASSEHTLTIIRGSTGKLFAQIVRGAPFDVFLSADSIRADKLAKLGKAFEDKTYTYAIGKLALWKPGAESSMGIKEKMTQGDFKKLAIANPKTAPYGKASVEALKTMEIYEEVKNKLVYGENITQTYQFVETGAADLGFVARSYVKGKIYWEVENYMHKPVKQKMLVLKQSRHLQAAKEFIAYLLSPEAQSLIKESGYDIENKQQ